MLHIFVLEDDFMQQSRLEAAIAKVAQAGGIKYKRLEIFGKPQQLLDAISETGSHQFFFLDIEIKDEEKKGMEIAKEIRAENPPCLHRLRDYPLRVYALNLSLSGGRYGLY